MTTCTRQECGHDRRPLLHPDAQRRGGSARSDLRRRAGGGTRWSPPRASSPRAGSTPVPPCCCARRRCPVPGAGSSWTSGCGYGPIAVVLAASSAGGHGLRRRRQRAGPRAGRGERRAAGRGRPGGPGHSRRGTGRGALRRDLEQPAHPGRQGAAARDPAALAAPAGSGRQRRGWWSASNLGGDSLHAWLIEQGYPTRRSTPPRRATAILQVTARRLQRRTQSATRGVRRRRRGRVHAAGRPRAVRGRVVPGGRGREGGARRAERCRQDHAAADGRRGHRRRRSAASPVPVGSA